MTKPIRYYVSRKNPLVWLAILLSLGVVVLEILSLCFGQQPTAVNLWFQRLLPMGIGLLLAGQLAFGGQESFYRTSTSVFWMCIYFGQVALDLHLNGGGTIFAYRSYVAALWVVYLAAYILYRMFVTGKIRTPLLISLGILIAVASVGYALISGIRMGIAQWEVMEKIADVCMVGALFLASLAARPFCDGRYHKTWGDRSDGRRLRTIDGMSLVGNYIMPDRNGASNSINTTLDLTHVERYIHKKRMEGMENFGITHVFLAAYVRVIAKYPGLNRFISGQRVYQRDDDIQFTMTIKKTMATDGEETMIKLHLTPRDTVREVYEKFDAACAEAKKEALDSSFDHVAGALASIPGLLLKFVVWVLKLMDYFGWLPKFLLEVSPFHASVIFTSMGSLGIPPIRHHLYDFGNLPVFVAFGRKYRKTELDLEGNPVTKRYLDYVINTDERTVDGFYYATVLKYFHKLLRNPEVLDMPVTEVVRDID